MANSLEKCVAECHPLAMALLPEFIERNCNYCLSTMSPPRRCGACKFVFYCSVECQKKNQCEHKLECAMLKGKFDRWKNSANPDVAKAALILVRLLVRSDLSSQKGTYSGKTFSSLLSHGESFSKSANFHLINEVRHCSEFLLGTTINMSIFTEFYARTMINNVSISGDGTPQLGIALYLDYAAYDHSCRPNVQNYPLDRRIRVVPLLDSDGKPLVDAHEVKKVVVSYTDLEATKGIRRAELSRTWLFHCECERCSDPDDDFLSAIACFECSTAIPIDDSTFRHCWDARFRSLSVNALENLVKQFPGVPAVEILTPTDGLPDWKFYDDAYKSLSLVCPNCLTHQTPSHIEFTLCVMSLIGASSNGDPLLRPVLNSLESSFTFLRCMDRVSAVVLPDCNVFRMLVSEQAASLPEMTPTERSTRLKAAFELSKKIYARGHVNRCRKAIKACEALLAAGREGEVEGILVEIEEAMRVYFGYGSGEMEKFEELCPFADRIWAFRSCLNSKEVRTG